jgi:hypothetical protein
MPTSTDLVTDLPADFETFGQAVATSMADLLGGTTGQILSKASNTNMDFTWITNDVGDITGITAGDGISGGGTSGTVTITNSMATAIEAKGDLVPGTADNTFSRLAVGANDTMLVSDSTAATGLAYKSATTLYPWQTWTPSYSNFTIGNATVQARYQQIGKTVNVFCNVVFGSTTSFTAYPLISLPVSCFAAGSLTGFVQLYDASAGTFFTGNIWLENTGTQFQPVVTNASSTYAYIEYLTVNTRPFTWTTSDQMIFTFSYEAA